MTPTIKMACKAPFYKYCSSHRAVYHPPPRFHLFSPHRSVGWQTSLRLTSSGKSRTCVSPIRGKRHLQSIQPAACSSTSPVGSPSHPPHRYSSIATIEGGLTCVGSAVLLPYTWATYPGTRLTLWGYCPNCNGFPVNSVTTNLALMYNFCVNVLRFRRKSSIALRKTSVQFDTFMGKALFGITLISVVSE